MNLAQRLIEADRASPKIVLVIGDGITDVYIHGRLEDSCQEGCQKFIEEERRTVPGGAANAARSLDNWHTRAIFLGSTGLAGPVKIRFMAIGSEDREWCAFRHDDDRVTFDLSLARKESMYALMQLPRRPNAVLLSDYDKGMLTPEFIRDVVGACKELSIPCVADVKCGPEVYQGAILKGNVDWRKKYMYVPDVLTRGEVPPLVEGKPAGSSLCNSPFCIADVKCVNHVGSGDCFSAHLTLALAHGFSLSDAAAIAHSAGRVYVQFPHNRPPRPNEIAEDMGVANDSN